MFNKLFSNILAISKGVFAGQIVNNQLNPIHISLATNGYRIQSGTLQIPDRFGLFSSGPPRLQVHEAYFFLIMVGWIILNLVLNAFLVFVCRLNGLPAYRALGAEFSLLMVPGLFFYWIASVYDRHREPGYEWGDWKLRKD